MSHRCMRRQGWGKTATCVGPVKRSMIGHRMITACEKHTRQLKAEVLA